MSKKRKCREDYSAFSFTFVTDSDGSERTQCFLCGEVLANTSLKPAKLKEHLTSIHSKNALDSVDSFCFESLDLRTLGLFRSSDPLRRRSLPSQHHIRLFTPSPRKRKHIQSEGHGKTVCPEND